MKFTKYLLFIVFSFLFLLVSCSNDSSSDVPVIVPKGAVKIPESQYFLSGRMESDWLFICYLNGDDTSLESGIWSDLNEMEKGLSAARQSADSDSVRCVVLWDGYRTDGLAGTKLYELGPDTTVDSKLSSSTVEITGVSSIPNLADGEVNMADYRVLSSYLKWVKEHYTAKKTVLQVSSHGFGAGGISFNIESNQKNSLSDIPLDLSLSTDQTSEINRKKPMSTREFSLALKEAGYGDGNKLDLLLLDICHGTCIEDAYQYADYAEYMLSSPNETPGKGHNYTKLFNSFAGTKGNLDIETFGKSVCSNFFSDYYKLTSGPDYPTITFFKLGGIKNCADKLGVLAEKIKNEKSSFSRYLVNSYYAGLLYSRAVRPDADKSYVLADVGNFARLVFNNSDGEIKAAADEVKAALGQVVLFSWRRLNTDSNIEINDKYRTLDAGGNYFGITILAGDIINYRLPSWYDTELDFGRDIASWKNLLDCWFN